MSKCRIETDSMGSMEVPKSALWEKRRKRKTNLKFD